MKIFLTKTSYFVLPFLLLFLTNKIFYSYDLGDLIRLGFIYGRSNNISIIKKSFKALPKQYSKISNIDLNKISAYKIMTIGDSFSEQDSLGYNNYLTNIGNNSIIHVDRFLSKNPIQTLLALTNEDFFDSVKIEYVILQSTERDFVRRCREINYNKRISIINLLDQIKNKPVNSCTGQIKFFSDATIKTPIMNLLYNFEIKPNGSQTFKVKTTQNFFTNSPNNLLFYFDDLECLSINNNIEYIKNSNIVLNKISEKLSKHNIKLIVLISPDKYDLYYPYIVEKEKFTKPILFEKIYKLCKSYDFIDSRKILSDLIKKKKDVYYYGDTHWTPVATKIIAKEILRKIKKL